MQPHSMCAVALATYMWNRPEWLFLNNARTEIEYTISEGSQKIFRHLKYRLDVCSSDLDKKFTVYILRDGGGIACSITVWRDSSQEGSRVYQTHSQQHVAGLVEEYDLWKNKLVNGRHRNSLKYKKFAGEVLDSDRKKIRLISEIKHPDKDIYTPLSYAVELKNIVETE